MPLQITRVLPSVRRKPGMAAPKINLLCHFDLAGFVLNIARRPRPEIVTDQPVRFRELLDLPFAFFNAVLLPRPNTFEVSLEHHAGLPCSQS